jgi:hypothetical protein
MREETGIRFRSAEKVSAGASRRARNRKQRRGFIDMLLIKRDLDYFPVEPFSAATTPPIGNMGLKILTQN